MKYGKLSLQFVVQLYLNNIYTELHENPAPAKTLLRGHVRADVVTS
jgi:hypothetical protein